MAILRASELARSALAGDTARMRQFSLVMNSNSMARICISMSGGWSPTGTFVMPGRSINVRFSTEQKEQAINVRFSTDSKHNILTILTVH